MAPKLLNPISSALVALLACALSTAASVAADPSTVSLPGERLPLVKVAPEQVPQPAPLRGTLAPNSLLKDAKPVFEEILGCKLPAVDATNTFLYCGDEYGAIWEASLLPGGPAPRVLAHTGGRPLSHAVTPDGLELVFTDAVRGLLSLDLTQKAKAPLVPIKFLSGYADAGVSAVTGQPTGPAGPIFFTQGIAVPSLPGAAPVIYFTDTADAPPALPKKPGAAWNAFGATRANLFSGKPTGRLLEYNRVTGKTTVVASGFYVANGIALSSDETAVILNESMSMRVLKVPLTQAAGITNTTVFANSPGYLDSVSATPARTGFWVCVFSLANPSLPQFSTAIAAVKPIRGVAGNLPEEITSFFINAGDGIMRLGNDGAVLGWLEDPNGSVVTKVSGVLQVGNVLYVTAFDGPMKTVAVPASLA